MTAPGPIDYLQHPMRGLVSIAALLAATAVVAPADDRVSAPHVTMPAVAVAHHAGPPAPWVPEPPPPRFVVPAPDRAPAPFSARAPQPWPSPAGTTARHLVLASTLRPGDPEAYDGLIREVAGRYGVDVAMVKAIVRVESAFDRRAVSPAGALGLMQLMPDTARAHGVRDVFAPRENLDAGCRYFRMLLDRYRGNERLALAAYNAGVQRVAEAGGVPAIAETRDYLERVLRYRAIYAGTDAPKRRL